MILQAIIDVDVTHENTWAAISHEIFDEHNAYIYDLTIKTEY